MPVFEMSLEQLKQYKGCSPCPSDFDNYWREAMSQNEAAGLEYTLTDAVFRAPDVRCSDLWFVGVGGARIHCKFLRPARIEEPLPAVCIFHGYMHHSGEWFERLPYVYSGRAVLVMDVRGQDGLSEDIYHGVGPTVFGNVVRGVRDADPHKLYFRDVYLDCAKAIQILMSMNGVDSARVAVTGKSQGGALALAAAALVPSVKLCATLYPFLSDFRRVVQMDLSTGAYEGLYYYFKKCDPNHRQEEAFFERMGYIDIQNLTPKIVCPVLWQTGLMDTQCPPSTQFAAYNKIASQKEMLFYPEHTHELITGANDEIFRFFETL